MELKFVSAELIIIIKTPLRPILLTVPPVYSSAELKGEQNYHELRWWDNWDWRFLPTP